MSAARSFRWSATESPRPDPETGLDALTTFFEHAPFGVAHCSVDGTIAAVNPALARICGLASSSSQPLRLRDLAGTNDPNENDRDENDGHEDDQAHNDQSESERLLRELIDGDREFFQIENESPSSRRAWIKWTAWRVPAHSEVPAGALLMAEDSTEQHHFEQRSRQAERLEAIGRLASGVAHDFNNLLTGVLLYCDLLLTDTESGNRARKYAEEIRAAGLQATGLIRQLLSLARPHNATTGPLSLNQVAEETRDLLTRLIGENIKLSFHLDPALGLIRMDPMQAQQILLNLVLNARDALSDGGTISVETRNCSVQVVPQIDPQGNSEPGLVVLPCALFVVSDNGHGMDTHIRKRVFEAFFTTKPAGKGNGLGLATVHDIVTRSGGLVHVASTPGCGTRVTVLLPLIAPVILPGCNASNSQTENSPATKLAPTPQSPEKESKP
jgi:signal transduction histidine kinase